MRFTGRGHPSVRATHRKTLEFGVAGDITARASCVVAVAARPEPPAPVAGPVRIGIRVAGYDEVVIHALGNPTWDPHGPAVVRRTPLRLPNTLATEADTAAADLPRDLVAALGSPDTVIEVDVAPAAAERAVVVLLLADPARGPDPALHAELAACDIVVAEDAEASRLVRELGHRPARRRESPPARGPDSTTRTLVVATADLPGATAVTLLGESGVRVETVGLPPALAAAAAAPSRAPLTVAVDERPRPAVRATPPGHRLVVRCPPADLAALLGFAAGLRGAAPAVVTQPFALPQRATPEGLPDLPNDEPVTCCLAPASAPATAAAGTARATSHTALDPAVAAAIRGLLADGVPTRSAARALAALTGRGRREAYELALALAAEQA